MFSVTTSLSDLASSLSHLALDDAVLGTAKKPVLNNLFLAFQSLAQLPLFSSVAGPLHQIFYERVVSSRDKDMLVGSRCVDYIEDLAGMPPALFKQSSPITKSEAHSALLSRAARFWTDTTARRYVRGLLPVIFDETDLLQTGRLESLARQIDDRAYWFQHAHTLDLIHLLRHYEKGFCKSCLSNQRPPPLERLLHAIQESLPVPSDPGFRTSPQRFRMHAVTSLVASFGVDERTAVEGARVASTIAACCGIPFSAAESDALPPIRSPASHALHADAFAKVSRIVQILLAGVDALLGFGSPSSACIGHRGSCCMIYLSQ
jgi:hypothetical protein